MLAGGAGRQAAYGLESFMGMIYALVHYPDVDDRRINRFRGRYDPQADSIGPRITLMFPVPESIGEGNLVNHLQGVLRGRRPFPIHLRGFHKSWDDYLFLKVQEGNAELVGLHGDIHTGVLADYRREVIPFVPHLTLGVFANDPNEYPAASEEAKRLGLDYRCVLDKVHLVKVNDDRSRIVRGREFSLPG